jgi:predicted methyltransferase
MEKIETRDGSFTYYSEKYDEWYHCKFIGAIEEARVKYAEPVNLKDGDQVLDFCFGLGYNTLAALKICENIKVTGIELDIGILKEILTNDVPVEYALQNEMVRKAVLNTINKTNDEKINIIVGDAEEEIKRLPSDSFNAVLFDPFSPGKHKEMWSLEIFKECFRVLKVGGRLTTYSCAKWIRANMVGAGFKVIDGPIIGRKSASTVAIKVLE